MNYLPFDLETALKHPERVVTRDGRKVEQLTVFDAKKSEYPIYGVLEGEVESFKINGCFSLVDKKSANDLFLLPEVKECWVNVYGYINGDLSLGTEYETKDIAIHCIKPEYGTYIKTIRITNEPE